MDAGAPLARSQPWAPAAADTQMGAQPPDTHGRAAWPVLGTGGSGGPSTGTNERMRVTEETCAREAAGSRNEEAG